ncbi:MAG: NAD-dependent epimerase/dehydratase family protein [Deltaproteobacteria bacterium]|nr:NAD-dependent epimerase/dehydratase family protein [Deltaproteobacteria bacterium]
MSVYVVTGCAGFIGSHCAKALLARGDDVVGVDSFNELYDVRIKEENVLALENVSKNAAQEALQNGSTGGRFTLIRGNLKMPFVREELWKHDPDVVIHIAAWAGVRTSIERPMLYHEENAGVTASLLDEVRKQSQKPKFIFASSSSVYGQTDEVPFREDATTDRPISPYAASKKSGELNAFTTHHLYGTAVTCLRFFTVYGPGQRPDLAIHKFAHCILDDEEIPQFGDGSSARDYTFIDDIIDGVLRAADRCDGFHIYNLGSASPISLKGLIQKMGVALDKTPRVRILPPQAGDVSITYADIQRAKSELGYAPKTTIDEGLGIFARWFIEKNEIAGREHLRRQE